MQMQEVKEIIEKIPLILEEYPEVKGEIYAILSREYVTEEKFQSYLKESDKRWKEWMEKFDRHIEKLDRHIEKLDRHIEEGIKERKEFNEKFAAMQEESARRFDAMQKQIDENFKESNKKWEESNKKWDDLKDWVEVIVGRLQTRSGKNLENVIAGALRVALKRDDISADKIFLRKKFIDTEGKIRKQPREYEVDLHISDGDALIFEIKHYGNKEAVEWFRDKCEVAIEKLGLKDKNVERVFVTLEKTPEVIEACKEFGITLA